MIDHSFLIDTSLIDHRDVNSGGYCDFLPIRNEPTIGFKAFKTKRKAIEARCLQKKLSKFDLAPVVLSKVCKIAYYYDPVLLLHWDPSITVTGWGYVTEQATLVKNKPYRKVQNLVDNILLKTKLKFWDSHWGNIGYINRSKKIQLVCIDTGAESFSAYNNTWGFEEPGPRCPYCNKYSNNCEC